MHLLLYFRVNTSHHRLYAKQEGLRMLFSNSFSTTQWLRSQLLLIFQLLYI